MSFLNIHQGDSAIWGTASYNADGLVEEILCHAGIKTTKWHLTWVDGDGIRVAMRQSKHNIIREGYTYYYDTENGLLISAAAENDSVSYHYIDLMME